MLVVGLLEIRGRFLGILISQPRTWGELIKATEKLEQAADDLGWERPYTWSARRLDTWKT
jgi:hypothetical protein